MEIRIKDNAAGLYARKFTGQMIPNREWVDTLSKVQGMWLEVETECLFGDQFNTVPIKGVSESGLRIMIQSVDFILDDVRTIENVKSFEHYLKRQKGLQIWSKDLREDASNIYHWVSDAVGDLGYGCTLDDLPEAFGEYVKENNIDLAKSRNDFSRPQISEIYADWAFDDPDTLRDLLGDKIHDSAPNAGLRLYLVHDLRSCCGSNKSWIKTLDKLQEHFSKYR